MDDLTIFCPSEAVMILALQLLDAYATTWRLEFAPAPKSGPPKCGVLVFGTCDTELWMLGDVKVPAVKSTRILGVTFSADYTWTDHVTSKITAAQHKFRALARNGLVSGVLSLNAATLFASAIIWPSLQFGRVATSIFLSTHEAEQSRLDTAHIDFGRQVLGVSGRAAAEGVLGELGWWPDGAIGAKHNLLFLNRAASADPLSWQFKSLTGSQGLPRHPLLVWFDSMQTTLSLPDLPQDPNLWKRRQTMGRNGE